MVKNILLSVFIFKYLESTLAQKNRFMKLLKYVSTLFVSFILLGCSNDDNTPQALSQSDIQGDWFLVELNANEPTDLNNDGISNTNLRLETDCFSTMAINFENDTYIFTYPKLDFIGENNDELSCTDTLNTGSYSLESGTLTATTTIDNSTTTERVSVQLDNDLLKFTITRAQVNEYLDLGSSNNENADLETLEFIFEK
jgi:hypothetical protein